jgi:hypothetical protein
VKETSDASQAAAWLTGAPYPKGDEVQEMVAWQPGDMTRYECGLLGEDDHQYLVVVNLRAVLPLPPQGVHFPVSWWVQVARLPRGTWAGLRPLLAALGAAPETGDYAATHEADQAAEFDARQGEWMADQR